MLTRRDFFRRILPNSDKPALRDGGTRNAHRTAIYVDECGVRLPEDQQAHAFAAVLDQPLGSKQVFVADLQQWAWVLHPNGPVIVRTIQGRSILAEYFVPQSLSPEAKSLWRRNSKNLTDYQWRTTTAIGFNSGGAVYGERAFFLFYGERNVALPKIVESFKVNETVQLGHVIFLEKQNKKLFKYTISQEQGFRQVPKQMPDCWPYSMSFTVDADGQTLPRVEYHFFCFNTEMQNFCRTHGLVYPENVLQWQRELQAFTLVYCQQTNCFLQAERSYLWWFEDFGEHTKFR